MATNPKNAPGRLRQLWEWLLGQWVAPVPADIALCEFECRKDQCLYDEWASCERRISKAGVEPTPADFGGDSDRKD
jgi:hypothetical protein